MTFLLTWGLIFMPCFASTNSPQEPSSNERKSPTFSSFHKLFYPEEILVYPTFIADFKGKKNSPSNQNTPVKFNVLLNHQTLAQNSKRSFSLNRENKESPFALIEKILDLPDDEIDIGLGNILIGKIYNPRIDVERYLNELSRISAILKERIGGNKNPEQIIKLINLFFFEEYKLVALDQPYPEDFLVHELLRTKRGRCMSFVALYMSVAERIHLPFKGVCIPEHIFVRWDSKEKKRFFWFRKPVSINVETTLKGITLPNSHYENKLSMDLKEGFNDFYLKPLTKKETLGTYLSSLSSALREKGRIVEAIEASKLAISVNPQDAEAWNNLGMSYRRKGYKDMALFSYKRALDFNPNFAEAWQNLGSVQDDNKKRIQNFKKAISIKPDLSVAWRNLVVAYYESKNYDLAWACANRCQALGHKLPTDLLRKLDISVHAGRK